jgi:hypothetical protein
MSKTRGYVHGEGLMSVSVSYTPFHYDPRGNRLERWAVAGVGPGHILRLRGPIEVVEQVQAVASEYQNIMDPASPTNEWTHELASPDHTMKREVRQLLDLLGEVVSLPRLPPVTLAIALDWYKTPVHDVDPRDWPNTEVGELVFKGKYVYKTQEEEKSIAGRNLAGRICNAISRRAVLNSAEVILNVPGHDRNVVSFGPRLAATVAKYMKIPALRVSAKSEFRPEAKSLSPMERAMFLSDEFIVPLEIRGRSALIVDDVFRSGGSMAAVGKAAHEAGAREIFGICPARTMRR